MTKAGRKAILWIVFLLSGIWFWKYATETEMRRLDKEVDRLCAIDGKTVVYETVKLPASKFNEYGQALISHNGRDETGFGYFVRSTEKMVAAPAQGGVGARLFCYELQILRTSDSKVMAEHIGCMRGGGYWMEGFPGVGSGKICPGRVPMDFYKQIFLNMGKVGSLE